MRRVGKVFRTEYETEASPGILLWEWCYTKPHIRRDFRKAITNSPSESSHHYSIEITLASIRINDLSKFSVDRIKINKHEL